tara:strand:+ start:621 stop:1184 length:564 start_codon:yes stop_codon:yes gene_type:complete
MKIQPGVGYTFDSSSKGFTLDTSQQFPDNQQPYRHPFQVINISYDAGGSAWLYQVVPGTLNNEVAQIDEDSVWVALDRTTAGIPDWPVSVLTPFDATTHKCYIYLRAGVDATNSNFPGEDDAENEYPRIVNSDVPLADTDTYGYVLLAVATEGAGPVCTVVQYVTGSLWGDRIKVAGQTAKYYYARI